MPPRRPSSWSYLRSFAVFYVPAVAAIALLGACGLGMPAGWAAGSGAVALLLGLAIAALVSYRTSRSYSTNLAAACHVLQHMSQGKVADRISYVDRQYIEPVAAAIDTLQDFLKDHFADVEADRNRLSTVLNTMVEGVIVVDDKQRIVLLNESACRLFRLSREAPGRLLFELVRNPQLQQWTTQTLERREPAAGEMELRSPVARVLNVRVMALPEVSPGGRAMIVASDISQLRKLERVRQEFVANASHELKTPLAAIKGCVETLIDGGAIDDPIARERFLTMLGEQADRLDHLVRDLLTLTRIESEGERQELQPVHLETVVTRCVARHRQSAERKSMHLRVEAPEPEAWPLAEEEALEHILDNLIDNAIKYTGSGGTVIVRCQTVAGQCVLEVEDTGIGIPQHHLSRIFERFYRVDRARSREVGGTGLGLSIVKHLVQGLGGEVTVASRVGKGSVFRVTLRPGERGATP